VCVHMTRHLHMSYTSRHHLLAVVVGVVVGVIVVVVVVMFKLLHLAEMHDTVISTLSLGLY